MPLCVPPWVMDLAWLDDSEVVPADSRLRRRRVLFVDRLEELRTELHNDYSETMRGKVIVFPMADSDADVEDDPGLKYRYGNGRR